MGGLRLPFEDNPEWADLPESIRIKLRKQDKNAEKWLRFHRANPAVLRRLYAICRQLLDVVGARQFGVKLIWERLRWLEFIATKGRDPYKLSNSHHAYYARMLMHTYPDLEGVFELRESPYDPDYWSKVDDDE